MIEAARMQAAVAEYTVETRATPAKRKHKMKADSDHSKALSTGLRGIRNLTNRKKPAARNPAAPARPPLATPSPRAFRVRHARFRKLQSPPGPETAQPKRRRCGWSEISRPAASLQSERNSTES